MSSKIEVSRELVDRIVSDGSLSVATHDQLRQALDAPVVERQPFRFLVKSCYGPRSKSIENADESMRDSIESARQYFGAEHEIDAVKAKSLVYISPGEWFAIPLYTAPPELAELQATIARLTVENERLKGGQGEPVAYVLHKNGEVDWDQEVVISNTGGDEQDERFEWRPVYASQPAPVSVVLPSPQEIHVLISKAARQADLTAGANYFTASEFAAIACLGKVKELNQ